MKEHRMPLDKSLTAATTPHLDTTATRLFELLTVADVATLLKVSKSWVYEYTRTRSTPRSDRLPHIKIGKYVRFDPQLVRAFLERRTEGR
jgi:excisionase family DNA binding protein